MKIVEQVNSQGEIELGYDTSLSRKEKFQQLQKYFPGIRKEDDLIVGTYKDINYSIFVKNVTYLGPPHPEYKKRIQIKGLTEFYQKSLEKNYVPLLLGIYTHKDVTLFCDFGIDTYLENEQNNSSAHVYTEDLASVFDEENGGIFQKEDFNKNVITVFRPDYIKYFLADKFAQNPVKDEVQYSISQETIFTSQSNYFCFNQNGDLVSTRPLGESDIDYVENNSKDLLKKIFGDFFKSEDKQWNGIECYTKMINSNYHNKFQPEWVGFYLEYEVEKYLKEHNLSVIAEYAQDKTEDGIDLDLYFPSINSFGDLKAHSTNSKAIQGNDWKTVFNVLNSTTYNNHIYYIVCEHDTEKDKDHEFQVTHFWNKSQNKDNLMSYSKKMKNSVHLKKYYILDINDSNKEFLSKFKQGINSNGKLRKPKIMIDMVNINKFLIAEVEL